MVYQSSSPITHRVFGIVPLHVKFDLSVSCSEVRGFEDPSNAEAKRSAVSFGSHVIGDRSWCSDTSRTTPTYLAIYLPTYLPTYLPEEVYTMTPKDAKGLYSLSVCVNYMQGKA